MKQVMHFLPRGLVTVLVALLTLVAWHAPTQRIAESCVDAGLKRALISFAAARTLNAAISVAQGTQISAQPLGVGISLSVGELLDPVNDLVEQFSALMLWASISFGVQKALLTLTGKPELSILLTGLLVIWTALYWRRTAPSWLTKILLVMILARFSVPLSALASDLVYRQALAKEYVQQQQAIEGVASKTAQASRPQPPTPAEDTRGFWEKMRERVTGIVPQINLDAVKTSLQGLPERLVSLIVIFLLQTLILPLAFLWLFAKLVMRALWPADRTVARG